MPARKAIEICYMRNKLNKNSSTRHCHNTKGWVGPRTRGGFDLPQVTATSQLQTHEPAHTCGYGTRCHVWQPLSKFTRKKKSLHKVAKRAGFTSVSPIIKAQEMDQHLPGLTGSPTWWHTPHGANQEQDNKSPLFLRSQCHSSHPVRMEKGVVLQQHCCQQAPPAQEQREIPRVAPQLPSPLRHTREQLCSLGLFITFSELLQPVLTRFCIFPFNTDSRICFNNNNLLETSPWVLWPISPLQMWTHTHNLRGWPWTNLPNTGSCPRGLTQTNSTQTLPGSPCPARPVLTHASPVPRKHRATGLPTSPSEKKKIKRAPGSPLLGRQWDKEPETEGEQNPSDQPSPHAAAGTAMGHTQEEKKQCFTGWA